MVSERVREVELKERGAKKSYEVIKLNDCCKVNRGFELKEFEEELKLREEKIKERCEELERKEKKVTEGFLECQRTLELKKEELIAKNRVLVFQEKKLIEQCQILDLKAEHMNEERKELELKEKELNDGLKGVELLKKEVDDKYVSVELKEKEISKGVNELELQKKTFDEQFQRVKLKEEEISEFSKQMSLMKEEVERTREEVNGRFRELELQENLIMEGRKGLELIEKEIDERFQVVELKEKEMSEGFRALELNKKRMNERCKRLELKEKQVYECLEVVKLREKQVNDGVHALEVKLMQLEDCSKRIELKQQKAAELREKQFNEGLKALEVKAKELEECCKMVDTRETELSSRQRELEMREHSINQLCQGLESKEKQIDEQRQSLELKEKESDEHCRSLELKEKELNEGFEAFELKKKKIDEEYREMKLKKKEMDDRSEAIEVKEKQIRRRRKVLDLREEQINERCKEQESEGKQQVKEENLLATSAVASSSISLPDDDIQSLCRNMDAEGLRSYLLQHVKDYDTLSDNLLDSLRLASDPAKLVLNVILSLYQLEFDEGSMRNFVSGCIFLLVQLMKVKPYIPSHVKDEARKFTDIWKFLLKHSSSPLENFGYLQYLASYNLAESHNADELLSHFITFCDEIDVCQPEQIPILCDALGLRKKITDLIQSLILRDKQLQAFRYICALKMEHYFPLVPLLRAHLENIQNRIEEILKMGNRTAQDDAKIVEVTALKEVVKCISNFKPESSYSPVSPELRIKQLEKERTETNPTAHLACRKRCSNLEKERVEEMSKSSNPSVLLSDTQSSKKRPADSEDSPKEVKHPRVHTHQGLIPYNPSRVSRQPVNIGPGYLHRYPVLLHQTFPPVTCWPGYHWGPYRAMYDVPYNLRTGFYGDGRKQAYRR